MPQIQKLVGDEPPRLAGWGSSAKGQWAPSGHHREVPGDLVSHKTWCDQPDPDCRLRVAGVTLSGASS